MNKIETEKLQWEKVNDLISEVDERVETLYQSFSGVHPIYDELYELFNNLSEKINSLEKNCNCDCESCFNCEYQDSGVRML